MQLVARTLTGRLGSLIYDSSGAILGDTAHAESVPPDLPAGIAAGRYFVAVDDGIPGNGPQPGDWLSSLTAVIPKMAAFVAAQDFAQVNANRARAGLPAINVLEYGPQCKTLKGSDTRSSRRPPLTPAQRNAMQLSKSNVTTSPPGIFTFQDRHARQLGALVQNPETGDWYDDGTGSVLVGPPAPDNIPGVLPEASSKGPSDWITGIVSALPKISAFLTAEQLAQVNIDRAKKGLPALQTSQYAPQVGIGLDPGPSKLTTLISIGIAGIIIVPRLLKRGRRR